MFLIGLTGGIASGKSTVSSLLKKLGAEVIDADQVARDVVKPGSEGLSKVVAEFGNQILAPDGQLRRDVVAEIVFQNAAKRQRLEEILHPLIKQATNQLIQESAKPIVVYEVPLLVEAGVDYPFDLVVTVEAGMNQQLFRLIEHRNMTKEQAQKRVESQASPEQRIQRADIVIDSSGAIESVKEQVESLWQKVQQMISKKASDESN